MHMTKQFLKQYRGRACGNTPIAHYRAELLITPVCLGNRPGEVFWPYLLPVLLQGVQPNREESQGVAANAECQMHVAQTALDRAYSMLIA